MENQNKKSDKTQMFIILKNFSEITSLITKELQEQSKILPRKEWRRMRVFFYKIRELASHQLEVETKYLHDNSFTCYPDGKTFNESFLVDDYLVEEVKNDQRTNQNNRSN